MTTLADAATTVDRLRIEHRKVPTHCVRCGLPLHQLLISAAYTMHN